VVAVAAASATVTTPGGRSQAAVIAPLGLREAEKPSNSLGEASVTVGTTPDGGAPAGTGVGFSGGAAWAGVVRPGGTAGDGQVMAREFVRRSQVGRESNVRNRSLRRGHDLLGRGRRRAQTGSRRCVEIAGVWPLTACATGSSQSGRDAVQLVPLSTYDELTSAHAPSIDLVLDGGVA
jgi:hypothetical protein